MSNAQHFDDTANNDYEQTDQLADDECSLPSY